MGKFKIVYFIFAIVTGTAFISNCGAIRQVDLEITNDPYYPNLVTVSNVRYQMNSNKVIELSLVIMVNQELSEGTKVLLNVSSEFPYAVFLDKMDADLCTFTRRELPMYGKMVEASSRSLPDRCPIAPGVYYIERMKIDLNKWPLLMRGFDAIGSFTIHKNGQVLAKINVKGGIK